MDFFRHSSRLCQQVGDPLTLKKVEAVQHFTKPPGHYSEASLVKAMEEHGIGRPATYASTLQTLQVCTDCRKIYELGLWVNA